jgi:hypothetical protein
MYEHVQKGLGGYSGLTFDFRLESIGFEPTPGNKK